MVLSTVDIIVRRWLLERGLSIHFYAEALYHCCTCLKILTEDTLQIVNAANLPVDDTGAAELPGDFDDDISVCVPSGLSLAPLPKQDWITPLRIHDSDTGDFLPYPNQQNTTGLPNVYYGFPSQWSYFWNVNDLGEPTGRRFGANGGTMEGYQIFRQRRQIQLTASFNSTNVVLLYISDGQSVDNASQIDTKANQCIKTFIDWQRSENRTNENSPEGRTFYNQKRRLKTLVNPITKVDIQNVLRNAYTAGIKT